jgi:hypothetical protein
MTSMRPHRFMGSCRNLIGCGRSEPEPNVHQHYFCSGRDTISWLGAGAADFPHSGDDRSQPLFDEFRQIGTDREGHTPLSNELRQSTTSTRNPSRADRTTFRHPIECRSSAPIPGNSLLISAHPKAFGLNWTQAALRRRIKARLRWSDALVPTSHFVRGPGHVCSLIHETNIGRLLASGRGYGDCAQCSGDRVFERRGRL